MSGHRAQNKELTDKQKIFMHYVAQGLSNAKIAEQMDMQPNTADQYSERIKLKLDLFSKEELKQYAIDNGYLEQEVTHE